MIKSSFINKSSHFIVLLCDLVKIELQISAYYTVALALYGKVYKEIEFVNSDDTNTDT